MNIYFLLFNQINFGYENMFVCVYIYECACTPVCVCVVYTHLCVLIWRSKVMLGVFFYCSLFFLRERKVSYGTWNSCFGLPAGWPSSTWYLLTSASQCWGYDSVPLSPVFEWEAGDLNSVPHHCAASTLPLEPSL